MVCHNKIDPEVLVSKDHNDGISPSVHHKNDTKEIGDSSNIPGMEACTEEVRYVCTSLSAFEVNGAMTQSPTALLQLPALMKG